ncbi:amidohydrolase [Blastopirellula marina]|uniref:Amidohydrolase n=1 Tax=Blastopirellula marina TaxID=124 RepID=A0A2S8F005_9BACT|nr:MULTISPECIES: amidohydrolase family protein [Pirellulaceae]PQO25490.1 amidohydrolase [Blastopirellula marina]RCS42454.1 amidohydrolase [Bremerella cremea]
MRHQTQLLTSCPSSNMPQPPYPIIDTHQHLWDPKRLNLPWLAGAGPHLNRKNAIEEYNAAVAGLPIASAIYMEVNAAPDQKLQEAKLVRELIASGTAVTSAAILSVDPGSVDFHEFANQFQTQDWVKGYRQVLHSGATPPGYCLKARFINNCRHLGATGKTFDLCMRPAELKDGFKLAEACPDTRFVLDHCGNIDPKAFFAKDDPRGGSNSQDATRWKEDMAALASLPNVACKISGIIARVPKEWTPDDLRPVVMHCAEAFGSDRVVFGTDWPVCLSGGSPRQWVEALTQITADWSPEAQQQLWSENAKRVYHLG